MLQALKIDPGPRPSAPRDPDPGPDLLNQAFAGYLASAANLAGMAAPAPALATQPSRLTPAPEPKEAPALKAAAPARGARTESRDARAEATPAAHAEAPEAPQPERPQAAEKPKGQASATKPDQAPEPPMEAKAAAQMPPTPVPQASITGAMPTAPQTSWAEITASTPANSAAPSSAPLASHPRTPGETAPSAVSLPEASAKDASAPVSSGPSAHFHFSESSPNATTKPALSELLAIPKPEIETPKPVLGGQRTEPLASKEIQPASIAASFKPSEQPVSTLPAVALASVARETTQPALIRADAPTPKVSGLTTGTVGMATSGPVVKGTTPVPGLESAQGAKANATFTQMDGTIRWLIKNQEKGAEIQLNPESLGRVVIKLRVEGNEVHARVWASEASTVPLLQDQRAALEASLRQQGLNLGSFNLQQGHRGDDSQASTHAQLASLGPRIAESTERQQDLPTVSPALLGGARLIEILA